MITVTVPTSPGPSGTQNTAGTFIFTVTATDYKGATATKSLSISIAAPPVALAITTTSLPTATRQVAYHSVALTLFARL